MMMKTKKNKNKLYVRHVINVPHFLMKQEVKYGKYSRKRHGGAK